MSILATTISRVTAHGAAVKGYRVTLNRGDVYFITADDGCIIRTDMPFAPSGQWRAVAVYSSRGAYISDWATFATHAATTDIPVQHKNGVPRYHIGDFDHGSRRVQGEGIRRIQKAAFTRGADGRWSLA